MTCSKSTAGKRTDGRKVIAWIERHCVFTNGRWLGKPFRLQMWQKRLILALFEVDPYTRRRLIRWAYIQLAKKNGKTELFAAVALWFLLASGEPAPLIVIAAGSDDQADTLFNAAKTMVERSPTLSKVCQVFEGEIIAASVPGGKIVRVSATARRFSSNLDSPSYFVVICDELHCWEGQRGRLVWETLSNGTVARENPMVIQLTTPGYDRESICWEQYTYAKSVISGEVSDPAYFSLIVEADDGDDWRDPEVWKACNPSYGIVQGADFYADQVTKKPEGVFRRFFLGSWWRDTADCWLGDTGVDAWEASADPETVIPDGAEITIGIDVALYRDHTAVVWCHRTDAGRFVVRCRTWAPPADGSGIDVTDVMDHIRDLSLRYTIRSGSYDPRFFDVPGKQLADEGIPMIEVPQSPARMIPACGFAYEQINAGNVAHDGDTVLTEHVLAAAQRTYDQGWTLSKNKSRHVIDACIAMVLALSEWNQPEPKTPTGMFYSAAQILQRREERLAATAAP
jgi:phage terminase large subunit-like protein